MIEFEKFTLDNGLRVIVHEDASTKIAALNLLYNVGSKDESPDKTGFAHLFEHLMFGGSKNIPDFDAPLQRVGGENNAFTSPDITNYYLTVPVYNLETGFWLESDRMLELDFSESSLEVQRKVVIEEYKQRYLNAPYGDVWLILRPLIYKNHPYRWPTIGADIKHIEDASLEDVKSFFFKHYTPANAILSIAGNVKTAEIKELTEKWFGSIESRPEYKRNIAEEPLKQSPVKLTVEKDVPLDAIYKAFRTPKRNSSSFYISDVISDILSRGNASRFYNRLIKDKELFTEIDAYVSGDIETGLFIIAGKLRPGVDIKVAEQAIDQEINELKKQLILQEELTRVKNKIESTKIFGDTSVLNKAMGLGYAELLEDVNLYNNDITRYLSITPQDVLNFANDYLAEENSYTLYYLKK